MNTVRYVRVQQEDGSYSTSIPIGADAENIILKNGVDAEETFGELKDADAALTSRVDGFTHLAQGSTTGDAELIDIRTAVDGTVYGSAGTAVRAQANKITRAKAFINDDDLLEIKNYRLDSTLDDISPVVVDPTLTISGAAADAKKTGDEITALKSDLIANDVIKQKYNAVSVSPNDTISADGKLISGSTGGSAYIFNVPEGTTIDYSGGSVYGFFATLPVKNETVAVDGTRHIVASAKITMPTGANYLVIRASSAPSVLSTNETISEKFDDVVENTDTLASALSTNVTEFTSRTSKYIGASTASTSQYYRSVPAFDVSKKYNLIVTVPNFGEYTIQAGTSGSISAMVDTIFSGQLPKGKSLVTGYSPTGAYTYIRCDKAVAWDIEIYQQISASFADFEKTPMVKTITKAQFNASPYNSLLGNLDVNSIVSIGTNYEATDYPHNVADYYTVITAGDSVTPVQIAIRRNGRCYTRKFTGGVWQVWGTEALEYSDLQLAGSSPAYTDFNDFPIGSILSVNALKLTNSPEGYGNTGHDSMDSGVISAVVMTYATKHDDPTMIAQTCLYYRNVSQGTPRIAYRTALLYNGSYIWTNWSTLSQDGVIHSTNKIVDINHLDYTFDDFDDAPANTIYQVDLNVANAVAHNPAPGKSGSLMTYGFSDSSRHALTQIYIALDNGVPNMYFRYGVINSSTQYLWTPWYRVNATQM